MIDQRTPLSWRETNAGAIPVSTLYDDPYFSLDDGLAETRHVFLDGNDLPDRFRSDFIVAELGFGTGLNFLVTLQAWQKSGTKGALHFTSFEGHLMGADDARKALDAFPGLADLARELTDQWDNLEHSLITCGGATLEVIKGDVRETLQDWPGQADAWFLDGFSPAKNPAMWEDEVIAQVGARTKTGGTFATYTAAGHVRRALDDAGFDVTRAPGFGRKRHMSRGRLR